MSQLVSRKSSPLASTSRIILALIGFAVAFAALDNIYVRFISEQFPNAGASAERATLYGVVSRLHVLIPAVLLILWKPRFFGFQIGKIRQHRRMLFIVLIVNCGVIATYLLLTRSETPYSNDQWLWTEIITVPLVEEMMWRGIIFSLLLLMLRKSHSEGTSHLLAVWLCGIAFGVLHLQNALFGVPVSFAVIQAINATIWGVVYSFTRSRTASVYPAFVLHAAMNMVVVLVS